MILIHTLTLYAAALALFYALRGGLFCYFALHPEKYRYIKKTR